MNIAKSHYDDCPYGCNSKGMILDTNLGKLVPCPHCSEKKKKLLSEGYAEAEDSGERVSLNTIFGIESEYLSTKFAYDGVIPEGERVFIDKDSLGFQKDEAEALYYDLSLGTVPESSYCFGISIKGRIDRFVYPMMAKAYLAGLTVEKFISCSEWSRMCFNMDKAVDSYYSSDLVFMLLNDGANLNEFAAAKGLMQSRALKGRPTIFITTWTVEACSGLLGFSRESSLFLARPVFVEYIKGKNKKSHTRYINGLLGVENDLVDRSEQDYGVSIADL